MKLKQLLLGVLCVFSGYANAFDNIYVSIGMGLGKIKTVKSSQDFPLLLRFPNVFTSSIDSMSLSFKRASSVQGAIGYRFNRYRIELEPFYYRAKYKQFDQKPYALLVSPKLSGRMTTTASLVNGYVDFEGLPYLKPFVGVGVGHARIKNQMKQSDVVFNDGTSSTVTVAMNDNAFVYQGLLGALFPCTETLGINLHYRYFSTVKKMKAFNHRLNSHWVNLGLRVQF